MKKLLTLTRYLFLGLVVLAFPGCETDDESALPQVIAGFTYTLNEATGTVTFINISENAKTYEWDFGDGTTTTEINPIKTFPNGTFTVVLEAFNPAGASETYQDEITVDIPDVAFIPITFDQPNTIYDVTAFSGASFTIVENPDESGTNDKASNVGQLINSGAAFEGLFIDLGMPLNLSAQKSVRMNFWSETGVDVLLKLEQGTGADVETTATHGGSGWEELVFTFNTDASFTRFTLFADGPGTSAGTFYLDDIEQIETPTPPFDSGLLTNGDFEAGVSPWIGNGANVATDGGNSYNQVNVTAAGNPFDVNLSQVVAITQGTNYILTFEASSDRARTMLAGIGLNEAPFTNTAPSVNLTTDTQTFTLQLAANDFGGANSRVLFDMGAEEGVVVIDNVSLVVGGDGSDTNGGGGGGGDASPFCNTPIQAFGGDAGSDILLSVFNVDSETMRIEIESADSDPVDLLVLPAGLWNPIPGISMSPAEVSPGLWAAEFFFPGGAPENVEFFIEWSKVSFAGNWRSTAPGELDTVPFNATCDTSGGGGMTGGCAGTPVAATSVPVDFEGCETFLSDQNFGAGITSQLAANPSKTGINTSDFVLQVDKPAGSDFFAGVQNTFASNFDLTTTDTFKVKIYSTKANVTFRFELALNPQTDPVTGNPAPVFVTIPNANEWVEVDVLFTGLPGGPTAYNQLVIKPDNDAADSPITVGGTYYIDDIILE